MRKMTFCALLAGVAVMASACGSGAGDAGENGGQASTGITLGYSDPMGTGVSLQSIGYGATQAIDLLGLDWTVKDVAAQLSGDKQISDIDTMITQRMDSIGVWVLNSGAAEPVLRRAAEAGIPTFGLNSASDSAVANIMSATDSSCDVSEAQAEFIAERIPNARLLLLEGPEVPSITFTTKCFVEAAKTAGLTIVDSATDNSSAAAGGQELTDVMLTANAGQFDAIWVFSDSTAAGTAAALAERGTKVWTGHDPSGVIVVSRGGTPTVAEYVRDGQITATWDSNFAQLGAAWVQLLHKHLVEGVALDDLPKEVMIPATLYTSENIEEYRGQLERDVPLPLKD